MTYEEKDKCRSRITEFALFVRKINPYLLNVKSNIAGFLTVKQQTIVSYSDLYKILDRYEALNLDHYTNGTSANLILNGADGKEAKD